MLEKNKIFYNVQTAFHMLRHFEFIETMDYGRFNQQGYSNQQIKQACALPGSKFFPQFATDIDSLLDIVLLFPFKKSVGINGNHILEFHIPNERFPTGIGTRAVVSMEELPKESLSRIFYEKNRDFKLAHLYVDELPVTNQCTLILKPIEGGYAFISAFSGESAMPIPDYKMTNAQFLACKSFWEKHLFLKIHESQKETP